ncbi:MAG: acyl transferase [Bacteroidota bacterium]
MKGHERNQLAKKIEEVDDSTFDSLALAVFAYQARYNEVYARYLDLLRVGVQTVSHIADIPPLPISCFKQHQLRTGSWEPVQVFTSSGTTKTQTSSHFLRSEAWYRYHASRTFEAQYGPLEEYVILALLPAYLERTNSSLVYMVQSFMEKAPCKDSGFYLYNQEDLIKKLKMLSDHNQKFLLIGVSFALLDLASVLAKDPIRIPKNSIVMETGGMKGRRKEMTRSDLHRAIAAGFQPSNEGIVTPIDIHSEYGMTELLSQAYAPDTGRFFPAPTLRVFCRELTDPLRIRTDGKTGAINCIDLANLDTISFIATDDLGRTHPDGSFEILGRMDYSDTRGCNLLYQGS